jgi:hypothetical protein
LPQPETKVIHPAAKAEGQVAAQSPTNTPFPDRPTTGLATNGK